MRRRTFLGMTIGSFSLPVLARGGRLYGTPASVTGAAETPGSDLLRLTLGRAELPPASWDALTRFGSLWQQVLDDGEARQAFADAPARFLEQHGLADALAPDDPEVALLTAVADPDVRALAVDGNYQDFLAVLSGRGLLASRSSSALRERLEAILREDMDGLRRAFRLVEDEISADSLEALLGSTPFQKVAMGFTDPRTGQTYSAGALAAVAVAVAVVVVTYVSVGVNVTVGINIGFTISVAVSVAVATRASIHDQRMKGQKLVRTLGDRPGNLNETLHNLAQLDPEGAADAERVARAAVLLGNDAFASQAIRGVIGDEVDAVFDAARSLGVVELPEDRYATVTEAARQLAWRSVGLPADVVPAK